jgi:hypothetical protein
MWDDWFVEQLREAIRKRSEKPTVEWFQDLIDQGVLDEKGNVLLRIPEPPGSSYPSSASE